MGQARKKGTRFERMARAIVRRQDAEAEARERRAHELAVAQPSLARVLAPNRALTVAALLALAAAPGRRR